MNKPILTAVYAIIEKDGKILKIKRAPGDTNEGLWEHPGGGSDPKETLAKSVIREVKEETGIDVDPIALVDMKHFETDYKYQIQLFFRCNLMKKNPEIKLSKEHDNFRWEEVRKI